MFYKYIGAKQFITIIVENLRYLTSDWNFVFIKFKYSELGSIKKIELVLFSVRKWIINTYLIIRNYILTYNFMDYLNQFNYILLKF